MKNVFFRIMLSVVALLTVSASWAQDIIVTKDALKIEAKILEVSKSEIKYKKTSNMDGPTFVLSTDEISTIIYSNGEVVLYNQQQEVTPKQEIPAQAVVAETPVPSTPNVDENTVEILTLSGAIITAQITELKSNYIAYILNGKPYTMPASQIDKVTFLQNGQIKDYRGNNSSYMPIVENTPSQPITNQSKSEKESSSSVSENSQSKILGEVYLEGSGYVGKRSMSSGGITIDGITSGGIGFNAIGGARFNKYVFTGFGVGLNTMFCSVENIRLFEMGIPLFADFRACIPTSKKQVSPYIELSVGPLLNCLKSMSGQGAFTYSDKVSVLAFFQANLGINVNHFTMSVGYELWANSDIKDHLFCFKIGGRI